MLRFPPPAPSSPASLDPLSSLPDGVLHLILSFLPPRLAVQTSLLSRRWLHLWRSLPDLTFDDLVDPISSPNDPDAFPDFVESFLLLRLPSAPLRRLHLRSGSHIPLSRLATWQRHVLLPPSHLVSLHISIGGTLRTPLPLLSCSSLRELHLEMDYWDVTLAPPFSLPSLRVLHLARVYMSLHGRRKGLGELIAACPVLSELGLEWCFFPSLEIHAPGLQRLMFGSIEDAFDVPVSVRAPKLRFLEHECAKPLGFMFGEMPELEEGSFDFGRYRQPCEAGFAADIIRRLANARVLTLREFLIKFPADSEEPVKTLPTFHNLKNLTLIQVYKSDDPAQSIHFLLQFIPNLEKLLMIGDVFHSPFHSDGTSWLQNVFPLNYMQRLRDMQHEDGSCPLKKKVHFSFHVVNGMKS